MNERGGFRRLCLWQHILKMSSPVGQCCLMSCALHPTKPPLSHITTPLRSRPFVWGVAIKTRNKSWKLQHTKHLITLCTTSWKCKLATTPPRIYHPPPLISPLFRTPFCAGSCGTNWQINFQFNSMAAFERYINTCPIEQLKLSTEREKGLPI